MNPGKIENLKQGIFGVHKEVEQRLNKGNCTVKLLGNAKA